MPPCALRHLEELIPSLAHLCVVIDVVGKLGSQDAVQRAPFSCGTYPGPREEVVGDRDRQVCHVFQTTRILCKVMHEIRGMLTQAYG